MKCQTRRSWAKVGVDLFPYRGRNYLICDDYYSSFWEIDSLDNTTSGTVIQTDAPSCQANATNEPVLESGQPEPVALPMQGLKTRSGRVI